MDFSKLAEKNLVDFLISEGIEDPYILTREEKIIKSKNLFKIVEKNSENEYPDPIVDLYIAANVDFSNERKYSTEDLRELNEKEKGDFADIFKLDKDNENFTLRLVRILGFKDLLDVDDEKYKIFYHDFYKNSYKKNLCPFYLSTRNSFGRVKIVLDDFYIDFSNLENVRKIKNIDENLSSEEACKKIKQHYPDLVWQMDVTIEMIEKFDGSEQYELDSYTNYGYSDINFALRYDPQSCAILNNAMAKLSPLPNDVIVYRGLSFEENELTEEGIFRSYGYLSTTIDIEWLIQPQHMRDVMKKTSEGSKFFMKIHVPAGTHAIYVGTEERELLLPHDIILEFLGNITVNFDPYIVPMKEYKIIREPIKTGPPCY